MMRTMVHRPRLKHRKFLWACAFSVRNATITPFNRWKQNQFWELNAFFRQTVALRRFEGGRNIAFIELTNQDFQGPTSEPEEAEIFYDKRNGVRVAAYPVFTDRDGHITKLSRSGFLEDVDRRGELAELVRRSDYLPVALVNRYWDHFFGYGFHTTLR